MKVIEYQGRKLAPILDVVRDRKIICSLEKKLKPGERLVIDITPAEFIFTAGSYDEYYVYACKRGIPRFLTSVDLFKESKKYRMN